MKTVRHLATGIARYAALCVLLLLCFVVGSLAVIGVIDRDARTEPGLVSDAAGLGLMTLVRDAVIVAGG